MATSYMTNRRSTADVTADTILQAVSQARTAFIASKDSAGIAAAHAYMVWLDTQSPSATELMRQWLVKEITTINTAIDTHNEDLATLRKRVGLYAKGALPKTDLAMLDAKTDEEREQVQAERDRLESLKARTDKEWLAQRKVRIERRNDASPFAEIVKYVFNFERRDDASVTARYAKVLEWIHGKFADVVVNDIEEITTAIKAAGGFEDALAAQRGTDNTEDTNDAIKDREAVAKAIVTQAKEAVANAPARATFDMQIRNAPEGVVTLLGRYKDGKVDVVGELPISEADLDKTVSMFADEVLLPTHDRSDFVARVLRLGKLVAEGDKTDKTEDDLKAGAALRAQRVLSLLPDQAVGLRLVMSARYADASFVIHGALAKPEVGLGEITDPVMLTGEALKDLHETIEHYTSRRLVDIVPHAVDGGVEWVTENSALLAENRPNGRRTFSFARMSEHAHKPLDVDGFRPQFHVTVTTPQLRQLYDSRLKPWADSLSGKKGQKHMTLSFSTDTLVHSIKGEADLGLTCAGVVTGTALFNFRPRDLHDLVACLLEQPAHNFTFAGDTGGLMEISWSDNLGTYNVYLPTATGDGKLSIKRVEPMRQAQAEAKAA